MVVRRGPRQVVSRDGRTFNGEFICSAQLCRVANNGEDQPA